MFTRVCKGSKAGVHHPPITNLNLFCYIHLVKLYRLKGRINEENRNVPKGNNILLAMGCLAGFADLSTRIEGKCNFGKVFVMAACRISNWLKIDRRFFPDISFESVTAYSDSAVVLAWIANDPKIFSSFVESRVRKIRDLTKEVTWKYVPSSENPADIASRGASPASLIDSEIWWNGPSEWQEAQAPELEELPEMRKSVKVCAIAATTLKPCLRR